MRAGAAQRLEAGPEPGASPAPEPDNPKNPMPHLGNPLPRAALPLLFAASLLALAGCQVQVTSPSDKQVADLKARVASLSEDWPNLSRYRADNASLGDPAAGEVRVVFMGDSITDAWPRNTDFFARTHYIGRGISGQTTPQMLARFRQDVIALGPKVVVILAGTNDIAGNTGPYDPKATEGYLSSMVELARANGIRVVLCSVLPAYDYPWRPGMQPAGKIVALNAWIRAYAQEHHVVYLDYFDAMVAPNLGLRPELSGDGVHPNPMGYAIMEPLAEGAVRAALAP